MEEEVGLRITALLVEEGDTLGEEVVRMKIQAGDGGGSYCSGSNCIGATGENSKDDGFVQIIKLPN